MFSFLFFLSSSKVQFQPLESICDDFQLFNPRFHFFSMYIERWLDIIIINFEGGDRNCGISRDEAVNL